VEEQQTGTEFVA